MYDSTLGRFLERDPVSTLYGYSADNPTNMFDPTGLQQKTPQEIADLLRKRSEEQNNPLLGFWNFVRGVKPEDTDSYKQLKKAFDQIKKDCKKAPGLPLALAPCGALGAAALDVMIQDLIRKLGDRQFTVRQNATESLASILPFALAALRQAANSKDPEVRTRADSLLARFESNCVFDQFRRLLQNVPLKNRHRLLELITDSPSAFPDSALIADVFIKEGTPKPPPKKPAPALPPGPAVPPPQPPAIFA